MAKDRKGLLVGKRSRKTRVEDGEIEGGEEIKTSLVNVYKFFVEEVQREIPLALQYRRALAFPLDCSLTDSAQPEPDCQCTPYHFPIFPTSDATCQTFVSH